MNIPYKKCLDVLCVNSAGEPVKITVTDRIARQSFGV